MYTNNQRARVSTSSNRKLKLMPPENDNNQQESSPTTGQEDLQQELAQQEQEITGHPAWQAILDELPTSLHNQVKPTLLDWDKGVQDKIKSVRDEYSSYEDFKKNEIDAEQLNQGLWLMDNLRNDPEKVAREIIEAFELQAKFNNKQEQETPTPAKVDNDSLPDLDGEFDITKHPEFIKMQETINNMQSESAAEKKTREEAEATADIDKQLEDLHKEHGEFDDMFVLSWMAQGQDGAKAVKQYQDTVNQAAARISGNTQQPPATVTQTPAKPEPVVMGGNSGAGSGTPAEALDFAVMKPSQRAGMVAELLSKRNQG